VLRNVKEKATWETKRQKDKTKAEYYDGALKKENRRAFEK